MDVESHISMEEYRDASHIPTNFRRNLYVQLTLPSARTSLFMSIRQNSYLTERISLLRVLLIVQCFLG